MPGFDRTGPLGLGPRTGGGFGFCSPVAPYSGGYGPAVFGVGRGGFPRGGGRGRTFGGGRGWWWRAGMLGYPGYPQFANPSIPYGTSFSSPEEEKGLLKEHMKSLEEELKNVQKRISDLEASPPQEPKK